MKDYIDIITTILASLVTICEFFSEQKKNKKLKVEVERRYTNTQQQNFSALSTSGDHSNINISATQTVLTIPTKILEKQLTDITNEKFKKKASDFKTSTQLFFSFLVALSFLFSYFFYKDSIPFDWEKFFILPIYIVSLFISFLAMGLIVLRLYQRFSIQKFTFSVTKYTTTIEKVFRFFQLYFAPIIYFIFQLSLLNLLLDFDINEEFILNQKLIWTLSYLIGNIYYYYFFSSQVFLNNVYIYRQAVKKVAILIILTIGILFTTKNDSFLSLLTLIFQFIQPK